LTNVIVQKNDTETSHDSVEEILSLSEIQNIDILNLCFIVEWCSDLEKLRDIYGSIIDYLEMKYNGLVKFPFVGNDDICEESNFQNNVISIVDSENVPDEDLCYFKELINTRGRQVGLDG
jgi:hypothetical protein